MKNKAVVIWSLILFGLVLSAFNGGNKYFIISEKDVQLQIPAGFPKPLYNFKKNKLDPAIFVLGRQLFYDPILSKDSTTSCASCHQRIAAFAHIDHKLSHGINGLIGKRNVPALQNLIWKDTYMWDGGVNNLEVQPISPITNPIEMNETMAGVVAKLKADKTYSDRFQKIFKDTVINSERILKALAQFTGLMISVDSRYDRYKNGTDTFSLPEKRGLVLFRAKCATCHKEPLFTDNSYRNNGIKQDTALKDKGRAVITGRSDDNNKFKVPSLRNIAMTYPYMHDGRFRNLKEVLAHYASAENFAQGADKALAKIGKLSEQDKGDLIEFLSTLSDKTFIYDRRFVDPFTQ